jgi:ubiquinone/menaquinone biosynthesis C-methylase UbiE
MADRHLCPWWLGYLLASPVRRLFQDPAAIVGPYVGEGMTVLEPGPGMGFFTLELARRVGPTGRVIAVDIQPRMISGLQRRLAKAGLAERVEVRLASEGSMGLQDLAGKVDFTLAMAVVHEMPSAEKLFAEAAAATKLGGTLLLAEPSGHVKAETFANQLKAAADAGFTVAERPTVRHSQTVLLKKAAA